MAEVRLVPGVMSDLPWATPMGSMKAGRGLNIRWRFQQLETLGLFGPLRKLDGTALTVTLTSGQPVRAIYTAQSGAGIQILAGALNRIDLIDVDPASIPGGETRYRVNQLGSALTPTVTETLPNPSLKRIVVPPVWWFAEQENVIIGQRAGVNESVRAWLRNPAAGFVELRDYAPTDPSGSPSLAAPKKAVAGGILNRIAVLLGCVPFGGTGSGDELMSVRWSARGNFELWNPTIIIDPVTGQANTAGGLQLDRGSRIVGGGFTGYGIAVWTDKAMAMLTETNNLATVFARTYIDGGRGLLANRSWCEADGQVWWMDEARALNVFDGGRPREIPNPLRRGTIDRVNEVATARIYMAANPEYGEVTIWYPSGDSAECDRALVYNYREEAWSVWGLNRTHWYQRQGIQEAVAVDLSGTVYAHDIGPACPNAYRPDALLPLGPGTNCGAGQAVGATNLSPITAFAEYGPMVTNEAGDQTYSGTRLTMSWLPLPAIGAESDEVKVTLMGFRDASVRDTRFEEEQDWTQSDTVKDYRVGGRSVSIRLEFNDIKTVYRLGYVDMTFGKSDGGER